ncbi:MAG TPA: hypothetical protein VNN77_00645 [candidate division Zixibacteria bacterium]|nr:hypothetical protein [candidate division Zixibacteria bacterium]
MDRIDLAELIENVIANFSRGHAGLGPPVFVTIPADLPAVPWRDPCVRQFVKAFLCDVFLTNRCDVPVRVAAYRRSSLTDLEDITGIRPDHWIQLRVSGRGLQIVEKLIEKRFEEMGYRCEEWLVTEHSEAVLGIFRSSTEPAVKMVFGIDPTRTVRKFDLLIPIAESTPLPDFSAP